MLAFAQKYTNGNNVVVSFDLGSLVDHSPLRERIQRGTTRVLYIAALDSKNSIAYERIMFVGLDGQLIGGISQNYDSQIRPGPLDRMINIAILETEMNKH